MDMMSSKSKLHKQLCYLLTQVLFAFELKLCCYFSIFIVKCQMFVKISILVSYLLIKVGTIPKIKKKDEHAREAMYRVIDYY
jgi:uncharacterized membrane protein